MDLSPKATRAIVEALDYRIKAYQEGLSQTVDEDEISDITE
jgi:hypothetical protein